MADVSAADLQIDGISAHYDEQPVLNRISCHALPGSILTLLGPSGCGKSTLLRVVAGLMAPSSGDVRIDGRSVLGLPPGERDVALVFQNYALYPHLSVRRNLALALESRRVPRPEIGRRIDEAARLLGIGDLLERRPRALSGGQQQRVALGRALVRAPRLYLLDEPLSNLDALLREEMRGELKSLFRRLGSTVLYVTHDQTEALTLSDSIVVLERGEARQVGTPEDVYQRPADLFVANFVGTPRMNLLDGRVSATPPGFQVDGMHIPGAAPRPEGAGLVLGIRPEDVEVVESGAGRGSEVILVTVSLLESLGSHTLLTLRSGSLVLRALVSSEPTGTEVGVRLPAESRHWFDASTGRRVVS
jgi:ABC-type sugar transport system ATPase subunit